MFFSSVKEIKGLKSKGMWNIYLNVTIEKNWLSQNFDFLSLKKLLSRSSFVEPQLTQISMNFQTSCFNLKIRGLGAKACAAFLLF